LDCEIETISFEEPIDSSNMNPGEWARIASIVESNYLEFDGFVWMVPIQCVFCVSIELYA
jgi:L-asparaginase